LLPFATPLIGPLPWLAIPAALIVARAHSRGRQQLPLLLGLFALIWFVMTNYVLQSLWVIPR
jgi:hypothetical protein